MIVAITIMLMLLMADYVQYDAISISDQMNETANQWFERIAEKNAKFHAGNLIAALKMLRSSMSDEKKKREKFPGTIVRKSHTRKLLSNY